jgi:hypothetical protein
VMELAGQSSLGYQSEGTGCGDGAHRPVRPCWFAKASKVCYVRDSYFIPMKTPCHKN